MTQESRLIYEALLSKGVLDTIAIRKATHLTNRESDSRFNRAMTELQADFKILPVAVTQSGAWRYAFAYDLVHRHYPELPEKARYIQENKARQELARLYFRSVGAAQVADLVRLFRWTPSEAERTVEALSQAGELRRELALEDRPGEWIAVKELF
jgi:uncharacterized protein YcaQ